jgi:hypothetical protein
MYTPFELFAPTSFYNPQEELYHRRYLAAAEAERRRRYQAALQEQAYLQELERVRRQRALEEEIERKRQAEILYRKELERRRREQEEEMERNKRQAALHQAYEQLLQRKKQEEHRKLNSANRRQRAPEYQLLQGPDGRLYRVMLNPRSCMNSYHDHDENEEQVERFPGSNKVYSKSTDNQKDIRMTLSSTPSSSSSLDEDESMNEFSSKHTPIFKNVVFNNCFNNENRAPQAKGPDYHYLNETTPLNPKKNIKNKIEKKKKKKRQSSKILIGGVEDASDSECEDEYKDFWHTRRPEHSWIEPVEFFNVNHNAAGDSK